MKKLIKKAIIIIISLLGYLCALTNTSFESETQKTIICIVLLTSFICALLDLFEEITNIKYS